MDYGPFFPGAVPGDGNLDGVSVSGEPEVGDVLTATAPDAATWLPPASVTATSSAAGVGAGARAARGVLVHIGDSNTNGRPGYRNAYEAEWLAAGGIFDGWTSYNIGQNGSILADWATIEVANLDNPSYSSLPAADYNAVDPGPGMLARAVNANPNLILISLGTNDLNSPSGRATTGTEANLRANLAALVNTLLARTKAAILLRMPQPFAFEDFLGITEWEDAAEAAEASRRLRQVYSEWRNVNGRVEVYDSHGALFGNSCADKAVNAQDPFGQGALIADSLHPSDLGYRRLVQQIAMQLAPSYPRTPIATVAPVAIPQTALWSVTLWVRGSAAVSGTTFATDVDISPVNAILGAAGSTGYSPLQDRAVPLAGSNERARIASLLGNLAGYQQLMSSARKSSLVAYSWASGTTTALTNLVQNQIVTAAPPAYAQLTFSAASVTGLGGGWVTFYTSDPAAVPGATRSIVNTSIAAATKKFGVPALPAVIGGGVMYRTADGNTPAVSLYLQNQGDGRYVNGADDFAAPGKLIGIFTFVAWQNRAALVFDATHYPGNQISLTNTGEVLHAAVTTGTISDLGNVADIYLTN